MGCIDRTLCKPIGIHWDALKFNEMQRNPTKSNGTHSSSLKVTEMHLNSMRSIKEIMEWIEVDTLLNVQIYCSSMECIEVIELHGKPTKNPMECIMILAFRAIDPSWAI